MLDMCANCNSISLIKKLHNRLLRFTSHNTFIFNTTNHKIIFNAINSIYR